MNTRDRILNLVDDIRMHADDVENEMKALGLAQSGEEAQWSLMKIRTAAVLIHTDISDLFELMKDILPCYGIPDLDTLDRMTAEDTDRWLREEGKTA